MPQTVPRQNLQTHKEDNMKILITVVTLALLLSGCVSIG